MYQFCLEFQKKKSCKGKIPLQTPPPSPLTLTRGRGASRRRPKTNKILQRPRYWGFLHGCSRYPAHLIFNRNNLPAPHKKSGGCGFCQSIHIKHIDLREFSSSFNFVIYLKARRRRKIGTLKKIGTLIQHQS